MKPFVLAIAALGLVGTIGTANATPDTSGTVEIWNGIDPVGGETDNAQQALPGAATAILGLTAVGQTPFNVASTAYVAPIDYHLTIPPATLADDTIPGFLASQQSGSAVPLSSCTAAPCTTAVLSAGQGGGPAKDDPSNPTGTFGAVTLFEFTFTAPAGGEMFSVTHDDGVSLFLAGTETDCTGFTSASCTSDLLPFPASGPTNQMTTSALMNLESGQTYDLWYSASNGLPEILETNTVPVPAPPIGRGLPVLLAIGGILFGAKLWERSKRRSPLETAGSHAAA